MFVLHLHLLQNMLTFIYIYPFDRPIIDYDDEEPYVRELPKVGRNDACPCGSGKKFKKCCMDK